MEKKRKEFILLNGTYSEKVANSRIKGLDLSRAIRDVLNECGYPCISCDPTCSTPNICELIAHCSGGGGGVTTLGTSFDKVTSRLTVTVNGISSTVFIDIKPDDTATVVSTIPFTIGGTVYPAGTALNVLLNAIIAGSAGSTNLGLGTVNSTTVQVTSDTGADVVIPSATTASAGVMTSADKTKLDGLPTSFINGVNQAGATVKWGGSLTEPTTITGNQFPILWENIGNTIFYTDPTLGNAQSYFQLPTGASSPIQLVHSRNSDTTIRANLLVDCDGPLTRLEQRDSLNVCGVYMTSPTQVEIVTKNASGTNITGITIVGDNIVLNNPKVAVDNTAASGLGIPVNGMYVTPTGEVRVRV
ncbi:MAG: hypothetical protein ACRDBG_07555 [Waterburya sp.]